MYAVYMNENCLVLKSNNIERIVASIKVDQHTNRGSVEKEDKVVHLHNYEPQRVITSWNWQAIGN